MSLTRVLETSFALSIVIDIDIIVSGGERVLYICIYVSLPLRGVCV